MNFVWQHCGTSEPSSPLLLMERLSFEMHKTYTETRLQLHLSPATIVLVDGNEVRKQTATFQVAQEVHDVLQAVPEISSPYV